MQRPQRQYPNDVDQQAGCKGAHILTIGASAVRRHGEAYPENPVSRRMIHNTKPRHKRNAVLVTATVAQADGLARAPPRGKTSLMNCAWRNWHWWQRRISA